jgi:hypothetical protein
MSKYLKSILWHSPFNCSWECPRRINLIGFYGKTLPISGPRDILSMGVSLILNATREHYMVQWRLFRGLVIMCAVWKYILLFPGNFSAVSTCWKVPLKKTCSMHYLHEYYMHALCKTWLYWAGSLKDDWSLPSAVKNSFWQKRFESDQWAAAPLQRVANICELHGEVDSIQTSLK